MECIIDFSGRNWCRKEKNPEKNQAKKIKDFRIIPKSKHIDGLEIADLIASPIGRVLIGKKIKEDFKIIKKKFRKNNSGHILGHGLVVFPQQKARPATQSSLI